MELWPVPFFWKCWLRLLGVALPVLQNCHRKRKVESHLRKNGKWLISPFQAIRSAIKRRERKNMAAKSVEILKWRIICESIEYVSFIRKLWEILLQNMLHVGILLHVLVRHMPSKYLLYKAWTSALNWQGHIIFNWS